MEIFKQRKLEPGQKVKVYKNLHNKKWSIMDYDTKLVCAHADFLTLQDVMFKVGHKSRLRAIEESKRNVHAYAIGTFVFSINLDIPDEAEEVSYNPFFLPFFYIKETKRPIIYADALHFKKGKCFAIKNKE